MDLDKLTELPADKLAALKTYVADLTGQRDTARDESINQRKTLKSRADTAEADRAKLLEKLGIDSIDDLGTLPDAKGAADAAKQYDAKLKRLTTERDDALKARDEATGQMRTSRQRATVAEAIGGHEFVARDVVESFIDRRLQWEGDDLFYKTDDGKLVSVKDGVAGIAKTRPELLKAAGTGGAGVRQPNAGSGGKTMTRAEFEAMPPAQRVESAKAGVQLT